MYKDKFVVAIKHNGKVLREFDDTVYIPFGSEYSIYLKNLNSVRAMATISIDGTDATEGVNLIVPANDYIDVQRFIKDGNLKAGNKFKFIERTEKIEEHRGIKAEDGLIRVEFKFEVPITYSFTVPINSSYKTGQTKNYPTSEVVWIADPGVRYRNLGNYTQNIGEADFKCDPSNIISCDATSAPIGKEGITVQGSLSEQYFNMTSGFVTESVGHVVILKLLGTAGEKAVVEAVTVKTEPKCITCGKKNKVKSKFCTECGTSLQIV